jgi:hypothetical protein
MRVMTTLIRQKRSPAILMDILAAQEGRAGGPDAPEAMPSSEVTQPPDQ